MDRIPTNSLKEHSTSIFSAQTFKKLPWVRIAVSTGSAALIVIGILSSLHILHHVGTLSPKAIQIGSYGSAATGFMGVGIASFIKKRSPQKKSLENIEHKEIKENITTLPTMKEHWGNDKFKSVTFVSRVAREKSIYLATESSLAQARANELATEMQSKTIEEIKEFLNGLPIEDSCIIVDLGNEILLRGQALYLEGIDNITFYDGQEMTLRITSEDIEDGNFFYGSKEGIEGLHKRIKDGQLLKKASDKVNLDNIVTNARKELKDKITIFE